MRYLCFIFAFFMVMNLNAQQSGRLESEFKIAIPDEDVNELWQYLIQNYGASSIKNLNTNFSSSISEEKFIDTYFDNENAILKSNNVGVRYRKRYIKDTLSKTLVQVKLPDIDSTGVARREIKFKPYTNQKKSDRKALHPFWKYIKPKDRIEINLHISKYSILGDDLELSVKVNQIRKRVYIADTLGAIMTITLDEVTSAYFPYPQYTEMEIEINEVRFTDATPEERLALETLNSKVKKQIMSSFENIKQDQTPKYNKMYDLLKNNWLYKIYDNLVYILLAFISIFAVVLLIKDNLKKI